MKVATIELTYEQIKLLKTCIALAKPKLDANVELRELKELLEVARKESTQYSD